MPNRVMLVDKKDKIIGFEDKLEAHLREKAKLHRAVSIFIFNSKKELMLQKRSKFKEIAPYLWSNTCCSHPNNNNTKKFAEKRLKQEMGFTCELKEICSVYYKIRYGYFIEHEITHVFVGFYDKNPILNKKEACDWKWITLNNLKKDIKRNSEKYTIWLQIILNQNKKWI